MSLFRSIASQITQRIWERHLPYSVEFEPGCEPTYYGASRVIADAMGVLHVDPDACFHWTHGCHYNSPYFIECLARFPRLGGNYLVGTREQRGFLMDNGFENVYAVGNPIVYAPETAVSRRLGSLLVMPPHLTSHTKVAFAEADYIEYIESIRDQFTQVVCCVSLTCWEAGGWGKAFEKIGIPCIRGAGINDTNALYRMRSIFDGFEYMTTNSMGSHIAYASALGCKVSVAGPLMGLKREHVKDEPFYKEHPHLLDAFSLESLADGIRKQRPEVFVEPKYARDNTEWGRGRIGWDNRLPIDSLAKLLWKKETLGTLVNIP